MAIPPGATIREQLNSRGLSQKEFAARMDLSEKHVSRLINGEVELTHEVAVKLEYVLGIEAVFWDNLEAGYRIDLLKVKEELDMEDDEKYVKDFRFSELVRFGWMPKVSKVADKVVALRKFFEVSKLSLVFSEKVCVAFRRVITSDKNNGVLLAWVQKARLDARKIKTDAVNIPKLKVMLKKFRQMTTWDPECFEPVIRKSLAECGVAFVVLPHLQGTGLNGATFVDGKKIVTGLTTRGDYADKFWFSFFHEMGHILKGNILSSDVISEREEAEVNRFAGNFLIDDEAFNKFKENGCITRDSIIKFAKAQSIADGIVVGRLQRENVIRFSQFNDLKVKYQVV